MHRVLSFIVFICITVSVHAEKQHEELLSQLDKSLAKASVYEKQRTDRIERLRKDLNKATDAKEQFKHLNGLFLEYRSYRSDSAFAYANRCYDKAKEIDDADMIAMSKCHLAFAYTSSGISLEAKRVLESINSSTLSSSVRRDYYDNFTKLWREEADRLHELPIYEEYVKKSNTYLDSLILVTHDTKEYWNHMGSKYMRTYDYKRAIECFNKFLSQENVDAHSRAMAYAELAWAYRWLGDEEKAVEYFIYSAINDNESATREITALYLLAGHIGKEGQTNRALKYIHTALDYINFYNARQRKIELGEILPQIEQERYEIISSQHRILIIAIILVLLLLIAIARHHFMIHRKNRQLIMAEEQVHQHLTALEHANAQLTEANKIKTEYIARSFYANGEYMAKFDKLSKAIERQVKTKSYDKILDTIGAERLAQERNDMYAAFDSAFLALYPDFIEKFNNLFEEKDRRYPTKTDTLNSEMRIFALIRLGITDSERIGKFLNYSVHTVNTYKTRVKNRSIIDNDKFEATLCET